MRTKPSPSLQLFHHSFLYKLSYSALTPTLTTLFKLYSDPATSKPIQSETMMDVWTWICELPNSDESNSPFVFNLATSEHNPARSIQLRAEPSLHSNSVTFSVCLLGFHSDDAEVTTVWVSDECHLSSDKPFLPLVLQLLQEVISRSPTAHDSTCPRSQLQKLHPDRVSWMLDSHSPETFSSFFNLVLLSRLFWLCACDAPSEAGALYFHSILAPNLEMFSSKPAPVVLRTFFVTVGTDVELCFMRTFGYMLAKWLILREVGGVGLQSLTPQYLGISYSTEAYGLWILKGYAPVRAMKCTLHRGERNPFPVIEAKESALRYALAHHQLEAVIQFEYTVGYFDGFIQVNARLDNIRLHVARLGFNKSQDDAYVDEKHFPSRIRVWVGPEVGASYVGGLSLGQSTNNIEKEVETHKIWKGSFGDSKVPKMKAVARMATKTKMKNWRWDQDTEGNAVVYDATLCDNQTGIEVATWKPDNGDDGPTAVVMNNLGRRYRGANRGFTKKGSLVIAGEESGTGVGWRLSKEMVGSVLKWRIGGEVWLTYWPNHVNTSYYETRCVEWCDEVDLPLIPT
ncbi:PREDICTED: uncharacterized protein LOC109161274 [Ipomoea nil]|uniref:uncharacterized protein LOC109161274 n=1 Tax=Ipomoea nil TaxID=35883 RepID=UPI00090162FB|nr:PREDICTED: uncharacterized protein LOC109161274 [Ipomoea nil]